MSPLAEASNLVQAADARYAHSITAGLKRTWSSDGASLVTESKRRFASVASSSSSPAPSSPFFPDSRLAAFDAPSSPNSDAKYASVDHAPTPSAPSSPLNRSQLTPLDTSEIESDSNEPLTLRVERGMVVQFGRKAKKPSALRSETTLAIRLPPSAKNASRDHCRLQLKSDHADGLLVEISVFGMNGMKVDGKLWRRGTVAVLQAVPGQKVDLGFWGWNSLVLVAESEKPNDVFDDSHLRTPIAVRKVAPPNSIATSAFESLFNGSDGDLFSSASRSRGAPSERHRSPSPSPSMASELSALSSPEREDVVMGPQYLPDDYDDEVEEDDDSQTIRPSPTRAKAVAHSLSLDLPGLIASAVVFQPRATVGVEEVVKALLSEVGGMWGVLDGGRGNVEDAERETQAVDAWWEAIEDVLCNEPFFGCISNAGLKDAAGTPLLPAYYYIPDKDPSASRVEALEPFVKRVRGARTAGGGKQYFWKRPVLKKK